MSADQTTNNANTPSLYEQLASEAPTISGERLKFVKGEYRLNDAVVPYGTEFIALMHDVSIVWVKFGGGKLHRQLVYRIADDTPPCDRALLGDLDQTKWELGRGGPKDPWVQQWLLPLQSIQDDGEAVIYTTDSAGGIFAIKGLMRSSLSVLKTGALPIVALGARTYKNDFGPQHAPTFKVTRWTEPMRQPLPSPQGNDPNAAALQEIATIEAAKPKVGDMDDDIPF